MRRIIYRLIALLTFSIGIAAAWNFQRLDTLSTCYHILVPPVPVQLSTEEWARLPNFCGYLVVSITEDGNLKLNSTDELGTVENPSEMRARLNEIFQARAKDGAYVDELVGRTNLPHEKRILKVVIIKAPHSTTYGDVVKIIDTVKSTGANPIILQIDDLPE